MKPLFPTEELTQEFHQRLTEAGFSSHNTAEVKGHPIRVYRRNAATDKPVIYVSAGIHGDEPAGPLALMELLKDGFFDDRATWLICPLLNPTGLAAGTRENHEGLDLNRGYFLPVSTETRGHVDWLEQQGKLDLAISLHEDYETSGFYLYEINCIDCPSDAHAILKAVSRVYPPEPELLIDDHEVREPGWIFHEPEADLPDQWPEAIWLAKHGTAVSYTFETPSSSAIDQRVEAHVRATRRLVLNFCERHSDPS